MSTREQIYAQADQAAAPETDVVATPVEENDAQDVAAEPQVEEDAEPGEGQFEDPAEYRKALKEFGAKEAAKSMQAEYEKKIEGLYKDLRKQRGSKRELKEQISALEAKLDGVAAKVNGTDGLREPTPAEYGHNPEAYAKAKSAYDLLQWRKEQERQEAEKVSQRTETELERQEWSLKMQTGRTVHSNLDEVMHRISTDGIGKHIKAPAINAIRQSPIGVSIYHFLGENPDVAETIEDMDPRGQVMAIRQLESEVYGNLLRREGQALAPGTAAPRPAVTPPAANAPVAQPVAPARKAPPAPPTRASGGAHTGGSSKPLTQSGSFEDYQTKRMALKKQGKW